MIKKTGFYAIAFFLLITILLTHTSYALDSEFEKNGEIYILVTDTASRGVYMLNNQSNENIADEDKWLPAKFLYDPLECRGIKVSNFRRIYTFGHDETGWVTDGIRHDVRIQWNGRYPTARSYYGHHAYHHAYHSGCNDNNCLPFCDTSGAKGYMIPINGTVFGQTGWYSIKNGLWYHSMDPAPSRGVAKYVYQDLVKRKYHNYNLYQWEQAVQGIGNPAKIKQAGVASSFEETKERHILNGCHDGCGVGQTSVNMGATSYITDVTISVAGNTPHTYFYIRANKTGAAGKILKDGTKITTATDSIIGNPNDSTAKFIGVSSKSANKDYVYILGDNEIKNWLSQVGFQTAGIHINRISVSDMWWQTGGMVFALDTGQNVVYKFERNESSSSIAAPMRIDVPNNVTDITSDGFGNLYFANTVKYPDGTPPAFTGRDVDYTNLTWALEPAGYYVAEATFLQGVEKTVWKRNYYNGMTTKVGKVRVGNIPWRGRVKYTGTTPPRNKTQWLNQAQLVSNIAPPTIKGSFATTAFAEISAINLASPPQVKGFKDGHVDICGPYEYDASGKATLASAPYEENKIYQFRVENFPWFDDYGVNTNSDLSSGDDQNGNGFTGGFVSTVVKSIPDGWPGAGTSGITYTWKVIKTIDRYGNPVPAGKRVILGPVETSNPLLNFLYEGGEYKVSVSANFHWYDYDKMPAGRLFSERHIVASYNLNAASAVNGNIAGNGTPNGTNAKAPVDAGFSPNPSLTFGGDGTNAWTTIKIQKVDSLNIPGGVGDIVLNPSYRSPDMFYPSAGIAGSNDAKRQKWDSRSIIAPDPNNAGDSKFKWAKKGHAKNSSKIPVFVISQGDTALFTIKENQANLPSSQYNSQPVSPKPKFPPTYMDRLKTMFLDDSMGTYTLLDPNYVPQPNTSQKIYKGNLVSFPEFKYIIHRDPLVIPYTKVGANELPTIRWKNAWNENTGSHIPNAGPNVKWTWELLDSNGNAIIVGEHNSTLSPELNPVRDDGTNMWDVPSSPGLYKLTVKINRIYVYDTFEEVGAKFNPSTGDFDKVTKAAEHAQNILIAGECYVYVKDTTAPHFVNGYDGSGINPHFYGYTGDKLNTLTSHPLSAFGNRTFEVFVEDNNPFDSGFRTPQLTAANSVTWLSNAYKPIEFSIEENQSGMINHETAIYKLNADNIPVITKVLTASPTGTEYETIFQSEADKNVTDPWKKSYASGSTKSWVVNDGGQAQFQLTDNTLKPFNNPHTVSTTKYTVDISGLDRFSRPFDANNNGAIDNALPDIQADCLPYYHASGSADGSDDYKFFFFARDSSGNISPSFEVAAIEVLDNNLPNIFVNVTDRTKLEMPGLKATTCAPSHIKENYMKYGFVDIIPEDSAEKADKVFSAFTIINDTDWIFTEAVQTITGSNNSILFPNTVLMPPDAGGATKFTFLAFPDIVEDNRIKFEVFANDNVPKHFGGPDSPLGAVDVVSGDPDICMYVTKNPCSADDIINGIETPVQTINFNAPLVTGTTVTTVENVNFRNPGSYYLVGYVRDRAPLRSRDSNIVNPAPNKRNFMFKLQVSDTSVNVHTLESD